MTEARRANGAMALFCAVLLGCVAIGLPVLMALAIGFCLLVGYGVWTGHRPADLAEMAWHGVRGVRGIIILLLLIGMLTALWRAGGTIAQIVIMAIPFIGPAFAPVATFLLCSLMSFLTGSSFGTGATMGFVCMTIGSSLGANPLLVGGAVLSGAYFGDRSSPLASSALYVCALTETDLFDNLRAMFRSAAIPFVLTVAVYLVAGLAFAPHQAAPSASIAVVDALRIQFDQGLVALAPAVMVLLLPLARVRTAQTMAVSILAAALVCIFACGLSPVEVSRIALLGYRSPDASLAPLIDGGGMVSMLEVILIVCVSSSYAGLLEGTGMLEGMRSCVSSWASRWTTFAAVTACTVPVAMISCNQTLATMLVKQLCCHIEPDGRSMAIDLEDSVILLSGLVPWSIACSVPLTMAGASLASVPLAIYLWLVPLWRLGTSFMRASGRA